MRPVHLSTLEKGDFFTLKPIEEPTASQVYVRDDYDRSLRKYDCYNFDDFCKYRSFKGDKIVYVDFFF